MDSQALAAKSAAALAAEAATVRLGLCFRRPQAAIELFPYNERGVCDDGGGDISTIAGMASISQISAGTPEEVPRAAEHMRIPTDTIDFY